VIKGGEEESKDEWWSSSETKGMKGSSKRERTRTETSKEGRGLSVEKCVIETSRVELFLAPSLFSIVLVVSP